MLEQLRFKSDSHPKRTNTSSKKNVPDAFINTGLERWLHVRGIGRLVIAGVVTSNSIESTARSAGNLGFNTFVASDGAITFDKADHAGRLRRAEEVHAMSLANMDGEYATVATTEHLLKLLQDCIAEKSRRMKPWQSGERNSLHAVACVPRYRQAPRR